MTAFLSQFISAILQILVFTIIPFIFFLFRKDKSIRFLRYVGLFKPTGQSILYVLFTALLVTTSGIILTLTHDGIREAVLSSNSVTGQIRTMGLSPYSLLTILLIALFKTSLSEEILFRGFIAKRLTEKFGFSTGNLIQSVFFGLIHVLLFWSLTKTTFVPLMIIFILTCLAGWIIGLIKEKYANGSIIPGWIAHGTGNIIAYYFIAFVLK